MSTNMAHVESTAVFLLAGIDGLYKCLGCKNVIADERRVGLLADECHVCGAAIWYYYGGQMLKRKIEELRDIKVDKDNTTNINLAAFFIQLYEKNTEDIVPCCEDAIYPAFGCYWDSKLPRAVETISDTAFKDDDEGMIEYMRFLVARCMDNKDGPKIDWKIISNVELADTFAYNRNVES